MAKAHQLRGEYAYILDDMRALVKIAERENRDLSASEQAEYNQLKGKADELRGRIEELESGPSFSRSPQRRGIPEFNTMQTGISYPGRSTRRGAIQDAESRAYIAYIKGDRGVLRDLPGGDGDFETSLYIPFEEARAVDSTMNITNSADGGATVPTGLAPDVAGRHNVMSLTEKLGCRSVPGVGTTVNYPYENADPNQLATTAEQDDAHAQSYERDAPVLAVKAFTLVKKTKKLELTEELLDDTGVNLLAYISDHIGRAIASTRNAMLITEAAANGSGLKTFASATAIAAGEPEDLVFHDTLGYYLDDGQSCAWVCRPATHGAIVGITGNSRQYESQAAGSSRRELLNYPIHYSSAVSSIGASAKSLYFGNWYFMGYRLDPILRMIRDPYSVDGLVILKYAFRAVFGVLQSGAVGYGQHPTG